MKTKEMSNLKWNCISNTIYPSILLITIDRLSWSVCVRESRVHKSCDIAINLQGSLICKGKNRKRYVKGRTFKIRILRYENYIVVLKKLKWNWLNSIWWLGKEINSLGCKLCINILVYVWIYRDLLSIQMTPLWQLVELESRQN